MGKTRQSDGEEIETDGMARTREEDEGELDRKKRRRRGQLQRALMRSTLPVQTFWKKVFAEM